MRDTPDNCTKSACLCRGISRPKPDLELLVGEHFVEDSEEVLRFFDCVRSANCEFLRVLLVEARYHWEKLTNLSTMFVLGAPMKCIREPDPFSRVQCCIALPTAQNVVNELLKIDHRVMLTQTEVPVYLKKMNTLSLKPQ
jgi:hypothetical protein